MGHTKRNCRVNVSRACASLLAALSPGEAPLHEPLRFGSPGGWSGSELHIFILGKRRPISICLNRSILQCSEIAKSFLLSMFDEFVL